MLKHGPDCALSEIETRIEREVERWIYYRWDWHVFELVDTGRADFEFTIELGDDELPDDCPLLYYVRHKDAIEFHCHRGGGTGDGMAVIYAAKAYRI
jgi:hypothetical protein